MSGDGRIIQSLLDTDFYKFTMLQAILHQYPATKSTYHFRCRNTENELAFPLVDISKELDEQITLLCELRFTEDELQYLSKFNYIKEDFIEYLRLFRLQKEFVKIGQDQEGHLTISVTGPMIQAMFFETFILSIVNELYFRKLVSEYDPDGRIMQEGERRLVEKAKLLKSYSEQQKEGEPPFLVSDFGTRRRFNFAWQEKVIRTLHNSAPEIMCGTSNVYLAKKFQEENLKIKVVGTMAHEYLQAFQAFDRVKLCNFQRTALESWVHEYRGSLGIALTDVVNSDTFLRDFDLYFAKLFDGLRHDSGDASEWGQKVEKHYKALGIDTHTKMLTFSDGLDLETAWSLHQEFKDRFKTSFGIGTNLTNDMWDESFVIVKSKDIKALNIVLKLVKCNDQPVLKISDTPGKIMLDESDPRAISLLNYMNKIFNLNLDLSLYIKKSIPTVFISRNNEEAKRVFEYLNKVFDLKQNIEDFYKPENINE